MAFGVTCLRRQKGLDQIPGGFRSDNAPAEANDVHVIILNALPRRKVIEDEACSYSMNFVGADGCTHTAAANRDAAIYFTRGNRLAKGDHKIGIIIIGMQIVSTEVRDLVTCCA